MKVHFPKDDEKDENIFYTDNNLFMYLEELAQEYGKNYDKFMEDIDDAIAKMPDDNDESLDDYAYHVHLMTALRTKGREFDTVVILDAVDGLFPIKYAEDKQKQEQERRLFYVAVTRAKKELIFMVVDKIRDKEVEPSPFLAEMGVEMDVVV